MGIWANVTPNDKTELSGGRFLHAAGAGTIAVKDREGNTFNLVGGAGAYHPFDAGVVMATGTTATGIVIVR